MSTAAHFKQRSLTFLHHQYIIHSIIIENLLQKTNNNI